MIDELIERCIENNGYVGLIVVKYEKDKKYFIDKFKELDCNFFKQEWKFKFNNKSYICILSENELERRRGNRNNYVIMDDRVNWKYRNNFIYPSLVPYRDKNVFYESVVKIFDINYSIEELKHLCKENPYFVGLVITNLERKNIKQLRFDNGSILTSCYYKNPEINELIKVYNNRVLIDKNIDFNLDLKVYNYTLCDSCNGFLNKECNECKRNKDKVLIKGEIIRY